MLEAVWPGIIVSEGVLKTRMGKLRQALGETARTPHYIDTVHGRGYRFIAPVEERLQEPADDRGSRRSTPSSIEWAKLTRRTSRANPSICGHRASDWLLYAWLWQDGTAVRSD